MKTLEKLFDSFCYWFDYAVLWVMTSTHKKPYYHKYMRSKYGDRYCSQELFDRYWRRVIMGDHIDEKELDKLA
jgi:hypothetical protein